MLGNLHRDTIFQALRAAGGPWRDVEVHEACGSTNAELARDPRPWRVVAADEQVSGRGRLDRSWSTPAGAALAMSVSLPLPPDMGSLAWLSPMTAMAVTRAVVDVTGVRCGWKWPNDVLAARRDGASACQDGGAWGKLCGILGQVTDADTLVMGIGVNLTQRAADLPVPTATSVALCGGDLDEHTRTRLIAGICAGLATAHADVAAGGAALARLADEYRAGCLTVGREVTVALPGGRELVGLAQDVDADGRLVVRAPAGELVPVAVGDVVHVRARGGGY